MNNGTDIGQTSTASATLHLRPELPADEAFLFEVYASTREEEMELTGWDEATRRRFLDMQFKAMCRGYRGSFPAAEFSVIMLGDEPVGRMVIDRSGDHLRVVDLALVPARRNQGLGTILLRKVCAEARQANKPVRLCVLKNNRALAWYERLGFAKAGEMGLYDELEWRPEGRS